MIEIKFDEPTLKKCECCGNITTRLTRFVYQDGDAFAVYYALFTNGHEEKIVYSLIGLGEWGEKGVPSLRKAFPVKIWDNKNEWAVTVTDRDESPWGHVEFLGQILDRKGALSHPDQRRFSYYRSHSA